MIDAGISIEAYHAADYVSASKISTLIHHGPRAYWLRHVRSTHERARKSHFDVGQAFEDAVCGRPRHVFPPEDLRVAANGALTTVEAKAWKRAQEADGKLVLSNEHRDFFEHGLRHLRENRAAVELIEASQEQLTIRAPIHRADETRAPGIQARPDWLSLTGCARSNWSPVAPDLKTVTDLGVFAQHVRRFGYYRQAAMVDLCLLDDDVTGVKHPLIVVEKSFPYRCKVFWLPDEYVAIGAQECRAALNSLAEHYATDRWPAVVSEEETLETPGYMLRDFEDEEAA